MDTTPAQRPRAARQRAQAKAAAADDAEAFAEAGTGSRRQQAHLQALGSGIEALAIQRQDAKAQQGHDLLLQRAKVVQGDGLRLGAGMLLARFDPAVNRLSC